MGCKVVCLCVVLSVFLVNGLVTGFNLDLNNYNLFRINHMSSMYGYSVALHQQDNISWIVIGAPKYHIDPENVVGGAFACEANGSEKTCRMFDIDFGRLNPAHYNTSDQWFGARVESLGVDKPLLVCAPRLIRYHRPKNVSNHENVPIGLCFLFKNISDTTVWKRISPCEKYLARSKMSTTDASCLAGFSTAFASKEKLLYVGSPGRVGVPKTRDIYAFELDSLTERSFNQSEIIDESKNAIFQYALTTGRFGRNGIMAASLPQASQLFGRVVVFSVTDAILWSIYGEQFGAYFGYALCTADVNGDGYDDLIISAPMYAPRNADKTDVGRVYVYIQRSFDTDSDADMDIVEDQPEFYKPITIDGYDDRGRFGTSMTSLGDINLDGYSDFAVGAPYAGPNNFGAVFIYRGSKSGPDLEPSQIIYAEDIRGSLMTFGFSLHGGVDVDGNSYTDLAVGAYDSNTVVVFKARPVIIFNASTQFDVKSIRLDVKNCTMNDVAVVCLYLKSCINFTGISVPSEIDVQLSWSLDTETKVARRMFFYDNSSSSKSLKLNILFEKVKCVSHLVYTHHQLTDMLTPLAVEMTYKVIESGTLPLIVDPVVKSMQRTNINIWKNCGDDDVCMPDLKLNVKVNGSHILGSPEPLTVEIIINNDGEGAYEANFYMTFPSKLYFKKLEYMDSSSPTCSTSATNKNTTLTCNIGNPLPEGKNIKFRIILVPSKNYDNERAYHLYFKVNSTNREAEDKDDDNVVFKSVDIIIDACLVIEGSTQEKRLLYNISNFKPPNFVRREEELGPAVTHTYSFRNVGPAPIMQAHIYIVWPYKTASDEILTYLLNQPETTDNMICSKANYNELHLIVNKRSKRSNAYSIDSSLNYEDSNESTEIHTGTTKYLRNTKLDNLLRCRNFQCQILKCSLNSLESDKEASFVMRTRLVVSTVHNYLLPRIAVTLSTLIVAQIAQLPYYDDLSNDDYIYMKEVIYTAIPEMERRPYIVPVWIVVVSSSFGSMVLLLLIYIMYKCGFFKRKRVPQDENELIGQSQDIELEE